MENKKKHYLFVDESGDPNFYSKRGKYIVGTDGCSSYLQFSLVYIPHPKQARILIHKLIQEILEDELLQWIPSLEKRRHKFAFHACMDVPEIRDRFIRLLRDIEIRSVIVHVSKDEALKESKYIAKPEVFYHEVVSDLFEHAWDLLWDQNTIYFEKRWKKNKQDALYDSMMKSLSKDKADISCNVLVQTPTDEVCLQIADYINRVVQRSLIKWENRFYEYLKSKIVEIVLPTKKSPRGSSVE